MGICEECGKEIFSSRELVVDLCNSCITEILINLTRRHVLHKEIYGIHN